MKNICFLIIVLSSLVAKANEPDSTNRKWELGIYYLPSRIATDFSLGDIKNCPIGLAILINKNTSEKLSFETGINYKYKWLHMGSYAESASFNDFELIININTNILEIPVKVKYYPFNKSKFSFYFTGGITNSFFFRESIFRESINQQIEENTYTINRIYYFLTVNLGIGGQYNINNKIGILFEPSIGSFAGGAAGIWSS